MSEQLNALGVLPDYHRHARHFARIFRGLGMTPTQVEAAIAWGAAFEGNPVDALAQFDSFCEGQGIPRELADLGVSWHAQVSEHGIEAMPDLPPPSSSPAQDAQRRAAIEVEMRKPRGDSAYWQNAALRDEYLAILERESGEGGEGGKAAEPAPEPDSPSQPQD